MARQTQIRSIQDCLNDGAYSEIYNSYPTLTARDALLILDHNFEYDGQNVNDLVKLIKEKVIPTLLYIKVNMGKQKVTQLKKGQADSVSGDKNPESITLQQDKRIGSAYIILGDCYNYIGDVTSAINYYTKAERCGVDCSQELSVLQTGHPTPNLSRVIAKAKSLKGASYQETAELITDYAYNTIDDILQLSIVLLSDDIHDNFRAAFASYLRNEVAGIRENPPMINLAGSYEKMLKELIYMPYAEYLDANENKAKISPTCQRLRSKQIARADKKNIPFTTFSNNLTLGNFKFLIIESIQDGEYNVDETFYNFITKYYNIDTSKFGREDFIKLARFTELFRNSTRNPAGHGVGMHRETFAQVCEELLLKEDSWVSQIVKITNNRYLTSSARIGRNPSLISSRITTARFNVDGFVKDLQYFVNQNGKQPDYSAKNRAEKSLAKKANIIRWAVQTGKLQLTENEMGMLRECGFVWEGKIDWFNDFYTSLLQYKNEYGTLDIPYHYVDEDGKHLGQQVILVRQASKGDGKIKLTQDQIQMLNNIEFSWDMQKQDNKWFEDFYQELIEYKAVFGNFKDVMYDKILGPQVMSFISCYVKTNNNKPTAYKITKEMVQRLEDIGFELYKPHRAKYTTEDDFRL